MRTSERLIVIRAFCRDGHGGGYCSSQEESAWNQSKGEVLFRSRHINKPTNEHYEGFVLFQFRFVSRRTDPCTSRCRTAGFGPGTGPLVSESSHFLKELFGPMLTDLMCVLIYKTSFSIEQRQCHWKMERAIISRANGGSGRLVPYHIIANMLTLDAMAQLAYEAG